MDLLHVDCPDWFEHAACRGRATRIWFPERGGDLTAARNVCAGCPVQVECLTYAVDHNIAHGVWGGASEHQRRSMRRSTAKCIHCGQRFRPTGHQQVCSDNCRRLRHNEIKAASHQRLRLA